MAIFIVFLNFIVLINAGITKTIEFDINFQNSLQIPCKNNSIVGYQYVISSDKINYTVDLIGINISFNQICNNTNLICSGNYSSSIENCILIINYSSNLTISYDIEEYWINPPVPSPYPIPEPYYYYPEPYPYPYPYPYSEPYPAPDLIPFPYIIEGVILPFFLIIWGIIMGVLYCGVIGNCSSKFAYIFFSVISIITFLLCIGFIIGFTLNYKIQDIGLNQIEIVVIFTSALVAIETLIYIIYEIKTRGCPKINHYPDVPPENKNPPISSEESSMDSNLEISNSTSQYVSPAST